MLSQFRSRLDGFVRATAAAVLALVVGGSFVRDAAAAELQIARSSLVAHEPATSGSGLRQNNLIAEDKLLRSRIERFSEPEAKQFYLGCSSAAMRGLLDSAEIAVCSIGYDVLLRRYFGGDLDALLAWSRVQSDD